MAGTGLKAALEYLGFLIVRKRAIGHQFPRNVMRRISSILFHKSLLQMGCDTHITLAGIRFALQKLDVARRRPSFAKAPEGILLHD